MHEFKLKNLALIPLHIILWIVVWLFYIYFFSYAAANEEFVLYFATSLLPITITVTYIIAYYLIPRFLLEKRYLLFSTYLLYTIVGSLFLIIIITFINFIFLSNYDMKQMPLLTRNFLFVFILVYIITGLVSLVQVLRYNYKAINRNTALEKKLLEGQLTLKEKELYYLKEQIHPHFLFNTLNTIYGAALTESKDTPDLILKLSNLLDYTLNQIEKKTVAISEEVLYISSYIGLEQVRFRDTLKVSFSKKIDSDIQVPPMLFIAFIENAFKHGSPHDSILHIKISLEVSDKQLHFSIKNTIKEDSSPKENHGLGMQNSIKRLETLYPNAYALNTHTSKGWYYLELIININ
ncbi:sensor histidine kinase [Dokdonia sp. Asnod1-B02]|uniref:sensor histidine kinase n=1 Tax=Dokdonia sp. Asnod1-B02 TaxID=3160573 RepID=UPI00386DCD45